MTVAMANHSQRPSASRCTPRLKSTWVAISASSPTLTRARAQNEPASLLMNLTERSIVTFISALAARSDLRRCGSCRVRLAEYAASNGIPLCLDSLPPGARSACLRLRLARSERKRRSSTAGPASSIRTRADDRRCRPHDCLGADGANHHPARYCASRRGVWTRFSLAPRAR